MEMDLCDVTSLANYILAVVSSSHSPADDSDFVVPLHTALTRKAAEVLYSQAPSFAHQETRLIQQLGAGGGREADAPRGSPFLGVVVETLRRVRDLRELDAVLDRKICLAAFLCGSMSYGAFYAIRPGFDCQVSDIDLMIVIRSASDIVSALEAMGELSYTGHAELRQARTAAHIFASEPGFADVEFHTKIMCWSGNRSRRPGTAARPLSLVGPEEERPYQMSLHFITLAGCVRALTLSGSPHMSVRCGLPKRQRDDWSGNIAVALNGSFLRSPRQISSWRSVLYRETHPSLFIARGDLYVGRFVSRLSPRAEFLWARSDVVHMLQEFQQWMQERLALEVSRGGGRRAVALSHVRAGRFAPHVAKELEQCASTQIVRSPFSDLP
ncbi:hypothetical protein ACJ7VE_15685 [Streptomyces sp. PB17]|uniref:hypothetical protein n=1 Tax=Streptomyces sp. PB17 TaxID=3384158 RepID=UPI0038B4E1DE